MPSPEFNYHLDTFDDDASFEIFLQHTNGDAPLQRATRNCIDYAKLNKPENDKNTRDIQKFAYGRYCRELKVLFHLSWPMCLSSFLEHTLFQLVVSIFCGHSDTNTYAAFVAAFSLANIVGTAFIMGLSTAVDTLFAQNYGGKKYKEIGLVLQKAILIYIPYIFVCGGFFFIGDRVLLALQVDKEIAILAGVFLKFYILSLPGEFMSVLLGKFLQCQGYVLPSVLANVLSNLINGILCYLLIFVIDLGVIGASLSISISMAALALIYVLIIYCLGVYKSTWPGWHWSVVYDWGPYIKLAIPGTIMIVSEWAMFEIGAILAGSFDSQTLSVQGVMYEFSTCLSMWSLGVSYAASIRVGHLLGAGEVKLAALTSKLVLVFGVSLILVLASFVLLLRSQLAYLIISDDNVAASFAHLTPYLVWCAVTDCVATVSLGIISGSGRQVIGAINNFMGYYLVALPLSVFLMFFTRFGLEGYWIGLTTGSTIQAAFLLMVIVRTDWGKQVDLARKRVQSEFPLLKPGKAGSALALPRYSRSRSDSLGVHSRSLIQLSPTSGDSSSAIIKNSIVRLSTPDLHTSSHTKVSDPELPAIAEEVDLDRHPSVESVSQGTYKFQCIKLLFYFFSAASFISGGLVALLLPVE